MQKIQMRFRSLNALFSFNKPPKTIESREKLSHLKHQRKFYTFVQKLRKIQLRLETAHVSKCLFLQCICSFLLYCFVYSILHALYYLHFTAIPLCDISVSFLLLMLPLLLFFLSKKFGPSKSVLSQHVLWLCFE